MSKTTKYSMNIIIALIYSTPQQDFLIQKAIKHDQKTQN